MRSVKNKIIFVIIFALLMLPAAAFAAGGTVKIAVIDTGITADGITIPKENVSEGKNYALPDNDTCDRIGHGTAVAAIILGTAKTLTGEKSKNITLVPLTFCDRFSIGTVKNGGIDAVCKAIYDAADVYGCDIINLSTGVTAPCEELRKAVDYAYSKGITVISAVGNDNLKNPENVYYPAAYGTVVGVGAGSGNGAADFSQQNSSVFLIAGQETFSVPSVNDAAKTYTVRGTSYSAAFVSAYCAAKMTEKPISPDKMKAYLKSKCRDIYEKGYDTKSGWGIFGAAK